jgi:hypothetical protein
VVDAIALQVHQFAARRARSNFKALNPPPSCASASNSDAVTDANHYLHAAHPRASHGLHGHGLHGYAAHGHAGHRHYAWRNGHRYVYGNGYNPGAAVAAGVLAGTAARYPYCGDTHYGSCDDYSLRWLRSSEQFPRFDKCHSTGFEGCGNFMRRPRRVAG